MSRRYLSLILTTALSLTAQAANVDPDPKSLEIKSQDLSRSKELVSQLGSQAYREREAASLELEKLGRLALPAVREGLKSSNPEISHRCERLVHQLIEEDMKVRIACFLADKDDKYDHKLPGAKKFFNLSGQSDGAKDLFREIYLSKNRKLMMALDDSEEKINEAINECRAEFQRKTNVVVNGTYTPPKPMELTDVLSLLVAESFVPDRRSSQTIVHIPLLSQQAIRNAIEDTKRKEAIVNIIGKWMDTRQDPITMMQALNSSRTLNIPNSMNLAVRLVESKTSPPTYRAQGMSYIAQYGSKDQISKIAVLLTEEGQLTTVFVAGNANVRPVIQIRDAALVTLLHVTKQKPEDYGYTNRYAGNNNIADSLKYSYYSYYFNEPDSEKKRKEALAKWKEWSDKNLPKEDKKK